MVALAVECKNLRPNNPLLLSAVPRLPREAFHQVIVQNTDLQPSSLVQDRHGRETAYPADVPVAKDRNQIGRAASGDFTTGDGDTYEKLNQAVNSCADLVQQMGSRTTPPLRRAIVPVLVVPDGVLWQVDYDSEGAVVTSPRSVETGTVYLDHSWPYQGRSGPPQRYRLSHMEVWTLSALDGLAERCFGPYGFFC
jgi:hypothetical protein